VPADYITHLIYAFANITADGSAVLSDPLVDIQDYVAPSLAPTSSKAIKRVLLPKSAIVNSSTTTTGPGPVATSDLQGNLAQLFNLKKNHRAMKTLLSFGGWNAGSANFSAVAGDESLTAQFAQSAVQMMEDYGFDGVSRNHIQLTFLADFRQALTLIGNIPRLQPTRTTSCHCSSQ
jgi:chitinase